MKFIYIKIENGANFKEGRNFNVLKKWSHLG